MKKNHYLVVMAGGSGTRFWPKSTAREPKQLLSFGGTKTLLQQTLDRFPEIPKENQWIVTTELLAQAIQVQAPGARVLAEPQARNTAPCVFWAARLIADRDPEAVMLVMPADHTIPDQESFSKTIASACHWAEKHDDLVTLGVRPTRAETGYGYLKLAAKSVAHSPTPTGVEAFVEKPNAARAEEFVAAGNYLWNGGMFVWKAKTILRAFESAMPEMQAAWTASGQQVASAYPQMTATSIDFGVMEKAKNVVTFELNCGWDDLGSWTSLETLAKSWGMERSGSVVSSGELVSIDSQGSVIDAPETLVALLGVQDLIIAKKGNALLIADKKRAQDIKLVVEATRKVRPDLV